MISGFILLAAALAALVYFILKPKYKNLPPGPKGLPILGCALQIDKLAYITFKRWAEKFGSIYMVDLAMTKTLVISDPKLVKEAFSENAFSGRPDFKDFDAIPDGTLHGLINTDGEHWEQLRRFTLRQLRDFGFGKNSMEESIMLEVNELIEILKPSEGKPLSNIKEKLLLAVVNSVWSIVTGKRHKQDDKELIGLTTQAQTTFSELLEGPGAIISFAPWVAKVIPEWSGFNRVRKAMDDFTDYFRKPVNEHLATYSEEFQRDFIDCFLQEIKKTEDPNSAFHDKTGVNNLIASLSDIYFAGTDTTSTTLSWLILYLTKFPEIQKKFQKEIEEVTGNTRSCSVSDRPNMPYTEALIAETSRFASIAPMGVAHRAIRDQEFKGYMIPKDSLIMANAYYIHHDPAIWGDPEKFRPERFLSPDGKTFKKHDALMPFSIGRRQCLGEALARDSLFLFGTNLFQRFHIEFDKNGPDHGFESAVNFILTPKPFNIILKDRLK